MFNTLTILNLQVHSNTAKLKYPALNKTETELLFSYKIDIGKDSPILFLFGLQLHACTPAEAEKLEDVFVSLFEVQENKLGSKWAQAKLETACSLKPAEISSEETIEKWELAKKILQLSKFDIKRCYDKDRKREYDSIRANKYLQEQLFVTLAAKALRNIDEVVSTMPEVVAPVARDLLDEAWRLQEAECRRFVASGISGKSYRLEPDVRQTSLRFIETLAKYRAKSSEEEQIKRASLDLIEQRVQLKKTKKELKKAEGVELFDKAYMGIIVATCKVVTDELAEEAKVYFEAGVRPLEYKDLVDWLHLYRVCERILTDIDGHRALVFGAALKQRSIIGFLSRK